MSTSNISKSDYSVSTVYYNNFDSGEHTSKGKSYKSFQLAIKHFNLLWNDNDIYDNTRANNKDTIETIIKHLICSLKCYKYNQDAKLLLKNIYSLLSTSELETNISIDSSLDCSASKVLLNSSNDYVY
jgi:hypothetical protein|tara:strand:+ start:122 stop:505 length:384 start_codon:yes stop_codon:yes gene_type:complete